MRILTWNLGLFPWCHFGDYLKFHVGGVGVTHEQFHLSNARSISEIVKGIAPEICVLQEFKEEVSKQDFIKLFPEYKHNASVDAWGGKVQILILSKSEIEVSKLGESEFFLIKTSGFSIVPVHLNSFYPWVRHRQVRGLMKEIGVGDGIDLILGDTNIWSVTKWHLPVFWYDKMSTRLLEKNFNQATRAFGYTSGYGLNLDKILVNKKLKFKNPSILRKNAKYMDHYPVFVDL